MFEILSPTGAEGARWQSYIDTLPVLSRDIHYTPAYARVQSHLGECFAAVGTGWLGRGWVLQPFMLRNDGHKDIVSLYGAGGPVSDGLPYPEDFVTFDAEFAKFREANNILCEYGQLNPLLQEDQRALLGDQVKPEHIKDVILVTLNCDNDRLFKGFSRNRQRGIKDAIKRGVRVVPTRGHRLFERMYSQSLIRLDAERRWYYPRPIWSSYLFELGHEHCSILKSVGPDGDAESMILVLHAYGKAYAHFLANTKQDSNDLLYYESMKYCRDAGACLYHLGGGLTPKPDDTLLAYKSGFSKVHAPVYTYKRIFDEDAYATACQGLPDTGFFPAYRAGHNANSFAQNAA